MKTWPTKKLGEICEIISPGIKKFEGSKKYIATADVDFDEIINFTEITYIKRPSRANMETQENDVLVARMAETKKFLSIDKKLQDDYIFSTGFAVLRTKNDLLPKCLFYFLTTKDFNLQKNKLAVGATQKAINNPAFKRIKIPFPPLKIQKQIVERLDKIAEVQKLNDGLIQKSDELFQSLLYSLIRANKGIVKQLGDIIAPQYGFTASAQDSGKYRFIRITDINDSGKLREIDKKYVNLNSTEAGSYKLKKGDLLLARTGATFGKILYFDSDEPSIFASFLIRLNPDTAIADPFYIWLFSRTSDYWRQAKKLMTGSGQPQFNANKLKQIKIPIPPLQTQKQIVEKLSAVQGYKKSLVDQRAKLKELFDSMLAKSMSNK